MRLFTVPLAFLLAAATLTVSSERTRVEAADGNSYFNALVTRPDYWRSYSLRDPRQLTPPAQGGLLYSNSLWNPWSYDSTMDAAKATIGEFAGVPTNSLAAPLGPSDTTATFNGYPGDYAPQTSLRIDNETIQLASYIDPTTRRASIIRGTRGTSPASHAAGAVSYLSNNSVKNMIILPLGTTDGNTYLFTWDSYWTDTNMYNRSGNAYFKAWQFENGGTWLEPRMRFGGGWGASVPADYDPSRHVASTDFRSYNELGGSASWSATNGNTLGPNVNNTAPVEPMGPFAVSVNQWLRHWVLIEQRANDYDYVSAWVADESRGPVQILNRTPVSVRPYGRNPNSIAKFWLELDTSQDTILTRQIGLPLISYHRNFVALLNPRDTTALMLRPLPGATPPPPGPTPYPNPAPGPGPTPNPQPGPTPAPGAPSAPQNLRIIPPRG